jgi:hypothetical protein
MAVETSVRHVVDFRGEPVRITDERMAHVLDHPEMAGLEAEIDRALTAPEVVIRSQADPDVRLCYRLLRGTAVGDKHLCVAVKSAPGGAFMLTAYLTNRPKRGEALWRSEQ